MNILKQIFLGGLTVLFTTAALAQPAPKPMTILVVGATGMIGSRVTAEAASRGHQVLAAARDTAKVATGPNIHPEKLDATDTKSFIALAEKADVIVLATSPRGGGDPIAEEKAVADSAIATARASHKRLFVVGGAGSLTQPNGKPVMDLLPPALQKGEPLALRNVLDQLKTSDIDWTFFSPAYAIKPGAHTGKYQVGTSVLLFDDKGVSAISAEDFADALVRELETPKHRRSQMTVAY